jgi:hypothetical protein
MYENDYLVDCLCKNSEMYYERIKCLVRLIINEIILFLFGFFC